jgi:SAM-dependent methyltransferase
VEETNVNVASHLADEQLLLWNGPAGHAWIESQEFLDRVFEPFERLLVEAVQPASTARVLDVGCGTGATTLAVARQLGSEGSSVGVDISEPMIAFARDRSQREGVPAGFVCADAQAHAFAPASFDAIISRFGVMFFSDSVRAFGNLRHAAKQGAALRCIVWRSAAENPFMTTAERAAAQFLPDVPPRRRDAPGQFAFADRLRVHQILQESGWVAIDIRPIAVACSFAEKDLIPYLTRLGPVGLILREADERTRAKVIATARAAFEPYVSGAEVRFEAACWTVDARAG